MPQNPVDRGVPKPSKSAQNNRKSAEKAIAAAAKRTAAAAAKSTAAAAAKRTTAAAAKRNAGNTNAGNTNAASTSTAVPATTGPVTGAAGAAGTSGAARDAGAAGTAGAANTATNATADPAAAQTDEPLDLSHLSKSEHKYLKRQRDIQEHDIRIVSSAKIYGPHFLC